MSGNHAVPKFFLPCKNWSFSYKITEFILIAHFILILERIYDAVHIYWSPIMHLLYNYISSELCVLYMYTHENLFLAAVQFYIWCGTSSSDSSSLPGYVLHNVVMLKHLNSTMYFVMCVCVLTFIHTYMYNTSTRHFLYMHAFLCFWLKFQDIIAFPFLFCNTG